MFCSSCECNPSGTFIFQVCVWGCSWLCVNLLGTCWIGKVHFFPRPIKKEKETLLCLTCSIIEQGVTLVFPRCQLHRVWPGNEISRGEYGISGLFSIRSRWSRCNDSIGPLTGDWHARAQSRPDGRNYAAGETQNHLQNQKQHTS